MHDCRSPISGEIDRLLKVENQPISFPVTEVNEYIPLQDSNLLHESIVETPSETPVSERVQRRTWVETVRQDCETLEYVEVNEKLYFTANDFKQRLVIGNQLWWALCWGQILSKFSGVLSKGYVVIWLIK